MPKQITGIMMYYYYVCQRKLWYFYHEIQMEQGNEAVAIGKLIDETTYENEDKHININNVINIDFLRSEGVLHEVKKSNKIEEASVWQVRYYLYYLRKHDVNIKGRIDYPLLKQTVEVDLKDEDIQTIEKNLTAIRSIVEKNSPPLLKKCGICRSCAYHDL